MDRQNQAKKLLPIIQAIADGKKLEYSFNGESWLDEGLDFELVTICSDIVAGTCEYRIKPDNCVSAWKDEPQPETTLTTTDHSCDCRGCKYASLESVDEPCCDCSDNSKYEKAEDVKPIFTNKIEDYTPVVEKHYREFIDCYELVETYNKRAFVPIVAEGMNSSRNKMFRPIICVKNIVDGCECLITGFGTSEKYNEDYVIIRDMQISMKELYCNWRFLDGSMCGLEE